MTEPKPLSRDDFTFETVTQGINTTSVGWYFSQIEREGRLDTKLHILVGNSMAISAMTQDENGRLTGSLPVVRDNPFIEGKGGLLPAERASSLMSTLLRDPDTLLHQGLRENGLNPALSYVMQTEQPATRASSLSPGM